MKYKNPHLLRRYYYLPVVICLLTTCYSSKEIVIDDELDSCSERWNADTRKGFGPIGRSSFGPFSAIYCTKIDSPKLMSKNLSDLHFSLFRYAQFKKYRKVYKLVTTDQVDTAETLLFVQFMTESTEPGLIKILDDNQSYSVSKSKDAEGMITIQNDTTHWFFIIKRFAVNPGGDSDGYTNTYGQIIGGKDTIYITNISRFKDGKEGGLGGHIVTKGITLTGRSGNIAALQLIGNNYVWIRNDLPGKTQLVIASVFSVILGAKDL
jgi:hypothetical protein